MEKEQEKEITFLSSLFSQQLEKLLAEYSELFNVKVKDFQHLIKLEQSFLTKRFVAALESSRQLAQEALEGNRSDKSRIRYFNTTQEKEYQKIDAFFPKAARAWVLDGLVISHQVAGLKYIAGMKAEKGAVIDVLNSASSLALGAENPWLLLADRFEDFCGTRDNVCTAYHVGLRQAFALEKIVALYPGKSKNLSVHMEASGSVVDTIAIESACAFIDAKKGKSKTPRRILAVDGTWAGDYGSSREGTGFGVDAYQLTRAHKNIWVDRCLPAPTEENAASFLDIIKSKLDNHEVAGLYLEPDIIGDLGIVVNDKEVLVQTRKILEKEKLPIILDCVQQLGRTGSYWGENVDSIFYDYPWLMVTTAKSSSNGQPFGFTIMPKEIAESAHPYSQVTTNQMNGPLLRALLVANVLSSSKFQQWVKGKGNTIEEVAQIYEVPLGNLGLRGKYLNRGIFVGSNENVTLTQLALLLEDGILVGALPQAIRYQVMLLELSSTNKMIAEVIFKRIREVQKGNISKSVEIAYKRMKSQTSGLARKSTN